MFKDTPEGQTFFCDHTTNNSICGECLGTNNKQPTPMQDRTQQEYEILEYFDDALKTAVLATLRKQRSDIFIDLIAIATKGEYEDMRREVVRYFENKKFEFKD